MRFYGKNSAPVLIASLFCLSFAVLMSAECAAQAMSEAKATSEAARISSIPRVQISDPREFVRELSQLGVRTSIADQESIRKLFGWAPEYVRLEQNSKYLRASFAQFPEKKTNVNSIVLSHALDTQGVEKGGLSLSLAPEAYCIRLGDLKAVLGDAYTTSRPAVSGDMTFRYITNIHTVSYKTPQTVFSVTFYYEECARVIFISKNES